MTPMRTFRQRIWRAWLQTKSRRDLKARLRLSYCRRSIETESSRLNAIEALAYAFPGGLGAVQVSHMNGQDFVDALERAISGTPGRPKDYRTRRAGNETTNVEGSKVLKVVDKLCISCPK